MCGCVMGDESPTIFELSTELPKQLARAYVPSWLRALETSLLHNLEKSDGRN